MEVARKAEALARGNLLTLQVSGSGLYGKNEVELWKNELEKQKEVTVYRIQEMLRLIHDLPDMDEKKTFDPLDIELLTGLLKGRFGLFAILGVSDLLATCLINISGYKGEMHVLLRQLVRYLIRMGWVEDPGNRSFALQETSKLSGIYPSQNLENHAIDGLRRLAITDTERPFLYNQSKSNVHCWNQVSYGLPRLTVTDTERLFLYNQSKSNVHCLRNQVSYGLPRLTITDTERPSRYDQSQPLLTHTLPTPPSYVVVSPSSKRILLLTLEAEKATKEKYCEFIEALRTRLASEDKRPDGKRVMCDVSAFCNQEQGILLVSISSSDTTSATLVIDRSDAYIVGYRVQNQTYLLDLGGEKEWFYDVFQDSKRLHLKFGYDDLEKRAEQSISEIQLGINQLKSAVARLVEASDDNVDCKMKIVAKSLIICIQMISEAGRFYDMEKKVRESITDHGYKSFKVDNTMLKRQKNWESVSSVIQTSYPYLALLKFMEQQHLEIVAQRERERGHLVSRVRRRRV